MLMSSLSLSFAVRLCVFFCCCSSALLSVYAGEQTNIILVSSISLHSGAFIVGVFVRCYRYARFYSTSVYLIIL